MLLDLFLALVGWRVLRLLLKRHHSRQRIGFEGRFKLQVGEGLQQAFGGGQLYHALRIPDSGRRDFQEIDLLLLTDRELYILVINNLEGDLTLNSDGSWSLRSSDGTTKMQPNEVLELKEKTKVLASYISRRGINLPLTFLKPRVVFVNSSCRIQQEILLQREVISYDQWRHFLQTGSGQGFLGQAKNAFLGSVNSCSLGNFENDLHYILSTAPTLDRLEMREGGILVGEFQGFRGKSQDMESLKVVKRSRINHFEAVHQSSVWSLLGFRERSATVRIICILRDYSKKSGQCGRFEIHVMGDLEIMFIMKGCNHAQAFGLTDIVKLTLRA